MPTLSLPIVVALVLLSLIAALRERLLASDASRTFTLVLLLYAATLVLIGLRWQFDLPRLMIGAAVLSGLTTVLLYLAFRSLLGFSPALSFSRDWPHLVPVALIAIAALLNGDLVVVLLVLTYLGYAMLLWRIARQGESALEVVKLDQLGNIHLAIKIAIVVLIVNALAEIVITADFIWFGGQHSVLLVAFGSAGSLIVLGCVAFVAGQGRSDTDDVDKAVSFSVANAEPANQDAELLARVEAIVKEQGLHLDSELNLQRLARRTGIPARQLSGAINRETGLNVSQWINGHRVAAACELLKTTDDRVTDIMLNSGFFTKSNFNREFRRVTGLSPSAWRQENLR